MTAGYYLLDEAGNNVWEYDRAWRDEKLAIEVAETTWSSGLYASLSLKVGGKGPELVDVWSSAGKDRAQPIDIEREARLQARKLIERSCILGRARGEDRESIFRGIVNGGGGCGGPTYRTSMRGRTVVVTKVHGVPCSFIFKLHELADEIWNPKAEVKQLAFA